MPIAKTTKLVIKAKKGGNIILGKIHCKKNLSKQRKLGQNDSNGHYLQIFLSLPE